MSDRIALGIIRKAHGVRGEASVEPWTSSIDRFHELGSVSLVSPDESSVREVRVEGARAHGDRALVKFAGIDSPEEVTLLRNWTMEIPADEARTLEADEYFLHDLVGLELVDGDGARRGVVTDVYEGGGGFLLAIEKSDGKRFELPFAADLCTEIDLARKRIVVALPEGIDDLERVEE